MAAHEFCAGNLTLGVAPIFGPPPKVSHGNDGHRMILNLVPDGVRKVLQNPAPVSVFVGSSTQRSSAYGINHVKHFCTEGVGRKRVTSAIPKEGVGNVVLGPRREDQIKRGHKAERRARASDQGTAVTAPERSDAFRSRISSAQDFATVASSSPSRLSRRARTSADRSSGARVSASSIKWSTRAFISRIIAGAMQGQASNFKLDADKFQGPAREEEACAWVRRPLKFAGQLGR
jgi:hypothetical protein